MKFLMICAGGERVLGADVTSGKLQQPSEPASASWAAAEDAG